MMSENPYAPPQAASYGVAEPFARKRWVAVLLTLAIPPIGMLYVVRPWRAIAYLAVGILIYPGSVMLGMMGVADAGVALVLAVVAWRVIAAIEAYRLAPLWFFAAGAL